MSLFLANIIGWITSHWRLVLYITAGAVLLIAIVVVFKSCGDNGPKFPQEQVSEAQEAVETRERAKMVEVLVKSDVAEQGIDSNIKQAEEATEKAKQNYQGKSNEELAAEIERRLQQ